MAGVVKCDLYCSPPKVADFVQIGWWPDTLACLECKDRWEALCDINPRCVSTRQWFRLIPA